jgi:hypothetical protein
MRTRALMSLVLAVAWLCLQAVVAYAEPIGGCCASSAVR